MIAHVHGTIAEKTLEGLIVDVAGIGYELLVPGYEQERAHIGETHKFYTYHHVREQAEELFGFSSLAAKRLFELLLSVAGVGPKMALSIASLGQPEHIRTAIANGDVAFVQQASGVGKRLAERVIVDLKDKVGTPTATSSDSSLAGIVGMSTSSQQDDALDALLALGYSLADAQTALSGVDSSLPVEQRIKQALKQS